MLEYLVDDEGNNFCDEVIDRGRNDKAEDERDESVGIVLK